jgi:hypothetical protein
MSSTTTTAAAARPSAVAGRPVWQVSALAALVAAVATESYGLLARAVGIPMSAGGLGDTRAAPITIGMFAMGTLICAFWGTVAAVLIARYARRPGRTYLLTTLGLTALSLVVPLTAVDTALATRLMLAVAHLLAAGIVIPIVTRRLRRIPVSRGE